MSSSRASQLRTLPLLMWRHNQRTERDWRWQFTETPAPTNRPARYIGGPTCL